MNEHYTFQEYLEKFVSIQDSYDYYFELQKEIDRLENIIKEVRGYINNTIDINDVEEIFEHFNKIETILDKENE